MMADKFAPYLLVAARVGAILGAAFLLAFLLRRVIGGLTRYAKGVFEQRHRQSDLELEKQAATIASLLSKTATVLIYCVAAVMALRELGFDILPMLAGLGVAGLAIGFGAQNLVRDVISGFFIIVENQIRVNDVVVINDTAGMVEEINLRTTILRDIEGVVHVFPNGSITKLANRTQEYSYYVFNLAVAWRDSTETVIELLEKASAEVAAEEAFRPAILGPLEVLGVDSLGESHVIVKARIKTMPGRQWDVGREINRRVKPLLEAAGLDLPVKGPRRVEVITNAYTREEMRTLIREVIEETERAKRLEADHGARWHSG